MTVKIGVLGLQGAVSEHLQALEAVGAEGSTVKRPEQLAELDGLILPGGESTTMRRLMDRSGLFEAIKAFAEEKPIFGTCAGLILLAKKIEGQAVPHLGLMDINVRRNAFGRQVQSFETPLEIKGVADDFVGVFIRAPYILEAGPNVEVLSKYEDKIVAAREGRFLAAAFHPELTGDARFHRYFVELVEEAAARRP
ncbi:pyridoxal 5'-phosphate synthase glutaminase subunit PdxT [Caenibacillus caldisaponilyticus]|uniref:pyridoxal 5'-phosphate synthase glutaminase subunit PdxT n=1 Tax=Caenibacillus caldisaponilyticus TaxID=1674942 RepID=UPI00098841BA|nr:pyridoxal 5'-phosphate synthase glutaminase subunit PdxT [Caenibacillus caldisaponilyticus]